MNINLVNEKQVKCFAFRTKWLTEVAYLSTCLAANSSKSWIVTETKSYKHGRLSDMLVPNLKNFQKSKIW